MYIFCQFKLFKIDEPLAQTLHANKQTVTTDRFVRNELNFLRIGENPINKTPTCGTLPGVTWMLVSKHKVCATLDGFTSF